MQLGIIKNKFEIQRLASIVKVRHEIRDFKEKIAPMLKVLVDSGINITGIIPGWCTYVHLGKDQKLPADVFGELGRISGTYPELEVGEKSIFGFSVKDCALWGLDVVLAAGTCKIRKIITTETREVESVKFEQVGDCSGLTS